MSRRGEKCGKHGYETAPFLGIKAVRELSEGDFMELNETDVEVAQARAAEQAEEQKLIRRLQMMMNMVMQVIAQDGSLTVDEAAQMIADSRKAALAMFPGKELAYDLIWKPRFQRLMRERFRIM
jgi:hypothetical protein